jgi:hypothetical protein
MLTTLFSKQFRVALPLLCAGVIGSHVPNSWADDAKPAAASQAGESPKNDTPEKPSESPEKDNRPDQPESDAPNYHTLAYQHQDSPLVYQFELINRVGARISRTIEGNISYSFSPKQQLTSRIDTAGPLVVNFRGTLKATVPNGNATELPLIQLGNFTFFERSETNGFAELQPSGAVIQTSNQGRGIDGLPWSFSTYPFPEMPSGDAKHWTLKHELALARSSKTNLALHFNDRRYGVQPFPLFGSPFGRATAASSAITGTLTLDYKRAEQTESETVIEETIDFDGKNLQPQVYLTGSGTIRFDHKAGLVTSIQRKLMVKFKDEANETSYPVEINLTRLEGEVLQAYQAEEKKRQQLAQRRMAEYKAKMDQVPTLADRDAVIELLKDGDDQAVETLVNKLRVDKSLGEDQEVGKLLYLRLFKTRTGLYLASDVIKVLAPNLFQSASIAREYKSGFDIGLTGDVLKEDTKLVRGQIVCYPEYSRWQAGTFYAAADDVVVLRAMDREQKLVVFLRSDCRLPSPQFIDPTTITLP